MRMIDHDEKILNTDSMVQFCKDGKITLQKSVISIINGDKEIRFNIKNQQHANYGNVYILTRENDSVTKLYTIHYCSLPLAFTMNSQINNLIKSYFVQQTRILKAFITPLLKYSTALLLKYKNFERNLNTGDYLYHKKLQLLIHVEDDSIRLSNLKERIGYTFFMTDTVLQNTYKTSQVEALSIAKYIPPDIFKL